MEPVRVPSRQPQPQPQPQVTVVEQDPPYRQIVINVPATAVGWGKSLTGLLTALLAAYVLWHNNKTNSPEEILKQVQGQVSTVEGKADDNSKKLDDVKEHAVDAKKNSKEAAVKAEAADKKLESIRVASGAKPPTYGDKDKQ